MANLNDVVTNLLPTLVNSIKSASESIQSSIGTLTQETSLYDGGSGGRKTNNGTSQEITVPAWALAVVIMAEGGDVRLEIDGVASATSSIFLPEAGALVYPIQGGIQTLFTYGVTGSYTNYRFLRSSS
jgi:hypothetical protein